LAQEIDKVLKANNVTFTINSIGSISVHFDATRLLILKPLQMAITKRSKILPQLLQEGIYIAPSAYETWFITDGL
jgi:glutamate-1-semialdehyde 2,1-aminomutase